ncbi:MAG: phage tail assembly chaperone [Litorimonas sp.]
MSWPFTDWHTVAVRRFQIRPGDFWDMALGDWLALMATLDRAAGASLSSESLTRLMKDYPDD